MPGVKLTASPDPSLHGDAESMSSEVENLTFERLMTCSAPGTPTQQPRRKPVADLREVFTTHNRSDLTGAYVQEQR